MPLDIALLILQRTRPDLKESHTHPWPHFCKLDALKASLDKDVMPNLNGILYILKRDDAIAYFRRSFAGREQVFENLDAAGAKLCGEAFKDEVGVGF